MKTIKEQYKEIVCGFNDERTKNVTNKCVEIADDFAIRFGVFLFDNSYEPMYQDADNDGRIWVSYNQEGFFEYSTAKRFNIQELLKKFKKSQGL